MGGQPWRALCIKDCSLNMKRINLGFIIWTFICISLMGVVGWITFGVMILATIAFMVIKDIMASRKHGKKPDADAGVAEKPGREGLDEGSPSRYYYEKYLDMLNDK